MSEPGQKRSIADAAKALAPYAALVGGQAADLLTTKAALKRPGTREANPIMGGMKQQMLIKSAGTIGEILAMRAMGKNHPKLAKAIGYAGGSIGAIVAAHNATVGR